MVHHGERRKTRLYWRSIANRAASGVVYTLPETLPPIIVAAAGPESAKLAGEHGDGLVSTSPNKDVVDAYVWAGGDASRVYGQITVCWQSTKDEAIKTALEVWPNSGLPGQLSQELALPSYFESAAELVTPEVISEQMPCGPDVQPILDAYQEYTDAGFTHVYIHQVGENQEEFIDMAKREILPNFSS